MAPAAPSCGVTTLKRSTVSRRGGPTRSSRETITCQYLGAYSAPDRGANIRDLGGVTCHCTGCGNIGIWGHGGLFITLEWGGDSR